MCPACLPFGVSVGACGRAALAILLTLAKMDGVPSFCLLPRFALVGLLANMVLFRVLRAFLAWFMVFVWVCLACVLCVDCGAFVCVRG